MPDVIVPVGTRSEVAAAQQKYVEQPDGTHAMAVAVVSGGGGGGGGGGAATVADGADVNAGATADAAVAAGAAGTLSAKMRRLTADLGTLLTRWVPSLGQQTSAQSVSVTPASDAVYRAAGFAAIPAATFARPADTTAYAVGDLVANSTTAGSVTPMQVTAARVAAGSFLINRVRLSKSGTAVTNAQFRVHLFNASPTVANGDNGVLLTAGRAGYIGRVDVDMSAASPNIFNDGAAAQADCGFLVALAAGQVVWALIEARAAYTPASGETFALTLEVAQN